MAFDLSTAKPASAAPGFDLSTAKPAPEQIDPDIMARAQRQNPDLIMEPEGSSFQAVTEPVLTLATGAIAEPVSGILGGIQSLLPGEEGAGAQRVESVGSALTYAPRTQAGQESLSSIGKTIGGALESVNQFGRDIGVPEWMLKPVGDAVFEATDSPTAGAIASAVPAAIFEFLGLKGLQKVRPGTKLLTDDGRPTEALQNALDKQGLSFNTLSPEAKAVIPKVAEKRLIPGGNEAVPASEMALVEQIKSGATDDALAVLQVVKGRVAPDPVAIEALRQGFDPGFVQAVKSASPESKQSMKKMLDIMQRVKGNRRLGLDTRPTDVVGDAMGKRISFIRDKATEARRELNEIASTQLKGKPVDASPVLTRLQESLGDLDVELIDGPRGIPEPVFKGSMISKDRAAQKVIKDAIDLMAEGGKPDALRFHKLKRQLDNIIDFKKKSAGGLSDAGRNVLKDIRSSLNQSIREVSPDYARVNDTLSRSLTALDNFEKVAGPSIDIFGEGSAKAIGQDMRGLMSNRKSRVRLENTVNALDDVAKDLGGSFGDDIKDLALFADSIEDRFGAVAQTSFKGEIESAINQAGQQGAKATALQAGVEKLAKGAEKLRGINDLNAFRAMSEVLNK